MKRRIEIEGIARDTLYFILEASRSTLPVEFAGLLRAEKGVITEVIMLPGTESSSKSALVRLYMLPNMRIAGSVHSHPSPNIRPSQEDLIFFSKTGDCHIIAGMPFDEESWTCYDRKGQKRDLPVLDVEIEDEDEGWFD
ncbi:Mov34/MPN/PAD-1 family protein [Candidatus Methanocrinis natronophilus]|uniref:Mov34/MPN/PAD-1 family protein n=1 Tax=Candidatus Methanocrinis natronophilus TaxID=3033396 RepID=A0ABT5XA85_9EURY|nr:Mov34/MPN/PAD-1 family protein [Candidatus Methanocrinis natronophilus]MDF0591624.1 Mov34/MPN/PAD-1 family protein [Candidatus Methanocrinis natronophilus]